MTIFLTAEDLLYINQRVGGPGAGVLDRGGVDAAAAMPQQSAFGEDAYPTLLDKAAALLRGLVGHQYFSDGNKRTGWEACRVFMAANGDPLGRVEPVTGELLVLAVAQSAIEHADVVRWLDEQREAADSRCVYALLTEAAWWEQDGSGTFSASKAGLTGMALVESEIPGSVVMTVVAQIRWHLADVGRDFVLTLAVDTPGDPGAVSVAQAPDMPLRLASPLRSGHHNHRWGIMPSTVLTRVELLVTRPVQSFIVLRTSDGEVLARLPLTLTAVSRLSM